jgi:hypothetical protein
VLLNATSPPSSTIFTATAHPNIAPSRRRRSGRRRAHKRSTRALDRPGCQSCIEILLELGSIDDAVVTHDERIDQLGAASLPKC